MCCAKLRTAATNAYNVMVICGCSMQAKWKCAVMQQPTQAAAAAVAHPMSGGPVQAAPVLSTWEDESGFEDLDLDQLVSQHNRSKATPLSSSSNDHSGAAGGSQSVTRPATAAASALVRRAAQGQRVIVPHANNLMQNNPAAALPTQQNASAVFSTQQHTVPSLPTQRQAPPGLQSAMTSVEPVFKYPAERLGLQGVNERLVDLSNLIIDAMCEPQQMAVLHAERKHLLQVQQRLKSAAAVQPNQPATQTMAPVLPQSHFSAPGDHSRQNSWAQPNSSLPSGFDSQQPGVSRQPAAAAFGQSNGWDQGAVSASLPGNPWEGDNQGRQNSMQHAGSSSFAYGSDAPFRSASC